MGALILFLILCSIASLSGAKEAILYGKRGSETFYWNEHILFVCERVFIFSIPIIVCSFGLSFMQIICCLMASFASYPFFHDGLYYETARQINRVDYRFWSNSKTSTAKFEITFLVRLIYFIIGCGIIILSTFKPFD